MRSHTGIKSFSCPFDSELPKPTAPNGIGNSESGHETGRPKGAFLHIINREKVH